MKLFDLVLIIFLVTVLVYQLVPQSAASVSSNTNSTFTLTKFDMKHLSSTDLNIHQIYYDYLDSTKVVMEDKTLPHHKFVAYLNPQISYSQQFDLIQIAKKSSKIISRQLLVFDLASPQPYVSLQSN